MQWIRPLYATSSYAGMRAQLRALKKRRAELLGLAVTRHEWPDVLEQVREVNRRAEVLEERLGRLQAKYQQQRKTAITDELLDISSGFEALADEE